MLTPNEKIVAAIGTSIITFAGLGSILGFAGGPWDAWLGLLVFSALIGIIYHEFELWEEEE